MNAKRSGQRPPGNRLSPVARAAHREARISLDRAQARLAALLVAEDSNTEARAKEWARLIRAAARYLVARRADGSPVDPVARLHLGNGARIERLNWLGDRSPRGLAQSAGVMVNYLYDRAEIEQNHEAFASSQLITVAPAIHDLLRTSGDQATAGVRVSRRASRLKRMILRP